MEIENKINNNINIEKNNFFNNIIGKTINNVYFLKKLVYNKTIKKKGK